MAGHVIDSFLKKETKESFLQWITRAIASGMVGGVGAEVPFEPGMNIAANYAAGIHSVVGFGSIWRESGETFWIEGYSSAGDSIVATDTDIATWVSIQYSAS